MAIPKEILAIERPKSTVVKKRGNRYAVVKRTSRRVGKRVLPVELGTIGEIVDGRFVPSKPKKPKTVDIKDYGEVAICHKCGRDILDDLADVWGIDDAKRLYVISLLRAAYGDVKNRDIALHYETSYISEIFPGVHLSENTISSFLEKTGQSYSLISKFMRERVAKFAGKRMVVDGMLKDYNSEEGSLSEFSRKARTKGSKDISLMYAYNPETKEPIAVKPYPGNMLDQTAIADFVSENKIEKGLMLLDKGFWNEKLFEDIDKMDELDYIIPLKRSSSFIKTYKMDEPTEFLSGYKDATVLFKKVKMKTGKYLYAFRCPKQASEQEVGYVQHASKNNTFDAEKYAEKKSLFGLIVFKTKANLDPLVVYTAYTQRWEIETLFNLYKNIIDRDTVNVHGDYRVYATELINFLSTIIASRVKCELAKTDICKKYSYKQVFLYLSKYKKVRLSENGTWKTASVVKYIDELINELGV